MRLIVPVARLCVGYVESAGRYRFYEMISGLSTNVSRGGGRHEILMVATARGRQRTCSWGLRDNSLRNLINRGTTNNNCVHACFCAATF